MGDFSQELTAICNRGGYISNSPYNDGNMLLTNGDRPSTVRSVFLLLKGTEGVNNRGDMKTVSKVLFGSPSQAILYTPKNKTVQSKTKNEKVKPIKANRKQPVAKISLPGRRPEPGVGGSNSRRKTLKKKQQKQKTNKKSKTKKIDYYINHIYGKN